MYYVSKILPQIEWRLPLAMVYVCHPYGVMGYWSAGLVSSESRKLVFL
jgi:hypothetical protein